MFFTVPLFRLGTELLGTQTLTPAKIFVGLTLLLWTVNILTGKEGSTIITLMREKANILLLFFLALTFISLINARYFQDEAINEITARVKMLALYLLIVGIIMDRRTLKIAILAFVGGSLLTTGVGLYELITGKAFFAESFRYGMVAQKKAAGLMTTTYGHAARVQGLYSDAGFHAHAMVIFFGLALPWLFYGHSKFVKVSAFILLAAYLANIIGTGARVGWVSLGCALVMFLILLKHRFKYSLWVISIFSVVTTFLALSLLPHLPTFARLQFTKDASYSWRMDTYRQALEMVRDHPLLGVGTGNYLAEYHNYLGTTPRLSRYFMGWLHNSYLQIWAENGTIGFLIFLFFMLAIFFGLLHAYLKAADMEMKALALGLLTAFTGYAVEFSGVPVLAQEPGWIILGFCMALINIARHEREDRPGIQAGGALRYG
ncbi:MAG: O-antigen ligase family protein [Thermodesulfobacteriota bacterium]